MSEITIVVDDATAERFESLPEGERASAIEAARMTLVAKVRERGSADLLAAMRAVQEKVAENPPTREEYNALMREIGARALEESEEEWRRHFG